MDAMRTVRSISGAGGSRALNISGTFWQPLSGWWVWTLILRMWMIWINCPIIIDANVVVARMCPTGDISYGSSFFGLPNKVTEVTPQIHHLYDYHKVFPVGEEEVQTINWGGLPSSDCVLFRVTEQGPVSHVSSQLTRTRL